MINTDMPKKTLALIVGLVIVTVILFVIAVSNNKGPQKEGEQALQPSPTSAAQTVLSMSPASVSVAPGKQGSVEVAMNPYGNAVTAVQLELQYDPTLMSNVVVTPGTLFTNPVVLINTNNTQTGRVTYAFGIQPNQQTVSGQGTVATVTFTGKGKAGQQAQLSLLPNSLVTARGIASSVLKSATGAVVTFDAQAVQTTNTGNTGSPAVGTTSPVVGQ